MRKNAWKTHEFSSSTPVMEKPSETKSIDEQIGGFENKYKSNEISENILIMELNKIYIDNILSAGSIYAHKIEDINKIKLHYAYLIINGERAKVDRRKKVLLHIVKQGY